jgi:hypothetical protein
VLQAVVQQGEGDATPKDGDLVSRQQAGPAPSNQLTAAQQKNSPSAVLPASFVQVYVHYSVLNAENDLLYTTWAEEGGSGQPLAFVLGKGSRAPRAWELSLLGEGYKGHPPATTRLLGTLQHMCLKHAQQQQGPVVLFTQQPSTALSRSKAVHDMAFVDLLLLWLQA